MAEEQTGTVFGPKAVEQIARTVREVSRRMRNETPQRGRWQQRESSGGGHTMWFTITSVVCPDDYGTTEYTLIVEPDWYTGGCSATPPGANEDGTYSVYDICGYAGTPDNLTGYTGRATYMYPVGGSGYGECAGRWILDDLCYEVGCQGEVT